eukprot:7386166-Prymnesium_polylepis.1
MALALGAPPNAATVARVARNLMLDVAGFGNKTTTGIVGIAFLLPALDKHGYGEMALAMLLNDAYPSLGWFAHQNMTTLCENWACTAHDAGGGSQNHIMLGGSDTWLLSSAGGLETIVNETTGGWRHVEARLAGGNRRAEADIVPQGNGPSVTSASPGRTMGARCTPASACRLAHG